MAYALHIGPSRARLPNELWQQIFNQTHSVHDAEHWAMAFGIEHIDGAYRRLFEERAPAILSVLPHPTAAHLSPKISGGRCAEVARVDCRPLNAKLYDEHDPLPLVAQDFSALYEAAGFMARFADGSPLSQTLLKDAHYAFTACLGNEASDERAYLSRCNSDALVTAWFNKQTRATLWLGHDAQLPSYCQGLPALHTLRLFDLAAPTDLSLLATLSGLRRIEVAHDAQKASVVWLRGQVARLCPKVCVQVLPHAVRGPRKPRRYSEAVRLLDPEQAAYQTALTREETRRDVQASGATSKQPPSDRRAAAMQELRALLRDMAA